MHKRKERPRALFDQVFIPSQKVFTFLKKEAPSGLFSASIFSNSRRSSFCFEVRFTGQHLPRALGSRVHVRFVQSPEPLASQWYRQVRQAFLKRFSV